MFLELPRGQAYELVSKHQGALQTNRYWVDLMSGLMLDSIPEKGVDYIRDFIPLVRSVQVKTLVAHNMFRANGDVQSALDNKETRHLCLGACARFVPQQY